MRIRLIGMIYAVGVALAAWHVPVAAQEKTATKADFLLKPGSARIILMRPTIRVGAQSTGGMTDPNADWTNQAVANIGRALGEAQSKLGSEVITYDEGMFGESPVTSQYSNLFSTVADSVIEYQFFVGNRLPTKKHNKSLEWGVGPGLAQLRSLRGADYALFINTRDDYGSTGRKVLQVVGAMAGVGITSGVHIGYAGLVDLKTGELVWLNADRQMGGDVRTPEGAVKRVGELLKGVPGRPADAGVT